MRPGPCLVGPVVVRLVGALMALGVVATSPAGAHAETSVDAKARDGAPATMKPPSDARSTVQAWARAWSEQSVDRYLAFYSETFQPAKAPSRSAWEAQRRTRIARPSTIEVDIENIQVTVYRDRTEVTFDQHYRSDNFSDRMRKKLVLVWENDRWKIQSEGVAGPDR